MKNEKQFCVYKHTNRINGKVYIGITSQKVKDRWGSYGQKYKGSTYFYNAIQKYGWDNFDHEILYDNLTQSEAEQQEEKLIAEYRSSEEEYGYNLMKGGALNIPNDEVRKKHSEYMSGPNNPMRGRKHTPEEIERLRQRFSGAGNPRYGAVVSEETRRKISESQKGKTIPEEQNKKRSESMKKAWAEGKFANITHTGPRSKRVRCVEQNKEFDSITAAVREMSPGTKALNRDTIQKALNDSKYTYRGYHWEFV